MVEAVKDKKHRSPAYPFIPLGKAVSRAQEFYEAEKRHSAPLTAAAKHWGYGEKSSGGLQTVSALKQFGLLADDGTGFDRRVKLTELAIQILLDEVPKSQERAAAIKKAALRPKLYAEMYEKWGVDLPSDETIRTFLKRDKSFNDDAVTGVIADFKDTIEYSGLTISDKIRPDESDDDKPDPLGGIQVLDTQDVTGRKPTPPPIGSAREVSVLEEGEAILQWPATLSPQSVEELEDWLTLVLKKLKRRYAAEAK